ncbi:hypothetical protein KKA94_00340, partial [Patescibacteria group bacterium]|nr:hypothetical protein [Patescibacteria group bacterium]
MKHTKVILSTLTCVLISGLFLLPQKILAEVDANGCAIIDSASDSLPGSPTARYCECTIDVVDPEKDCSEHDTGFPFDHTFTINYTDETNIYQILRDYEALGYPEACVNSAVNRQLMDLFLQDARIFDHPIVSAEECTRYQFTREADEGSLSLHCEEIIPTPTAEQTEIQKIICGPDLQISIPGLHFSSAQEVAERYTIQESDGTYV